MRCGDTTGLRYDSADGDSRAVFDFSKAVPEARLERMPLFIFGRYKKLVPGLSQSRWLCATCEGKGCPSCGGKGKNYESVEERIGEPAKGARGARVCAACLGKGGRGCDQHRGEAVRAGIWDPVRGLDLGAEREDSAEAGRWRGGLAAIRPEGGCRGGHRIAFRQDLRGRCRIRQGVGHHSGWQGHAIDGGAEDNAPADPYPCRAQAC